MPRRNRTIPHQPQPRTNPCDSKRRYTTEREAQETADYQMLLHQDIQLAVYKCDQCSGWHLTSKK